VDGFDKRNLDGEGAGAYTMAATRLENELHQRAVVSAQLLDHLMRIGSIAAVVLAGHQQARNRESTKFIELLAVGDFARNVPEDAVWILGGEAGAPGRAVRVSDGQQRRVGQLGMTAGDGQV